MLRRCCFTLGLLLLVCVSSLSASHILWNDTLESGAAQGYLGSTLLGTVVANPLVNGTNSSSKVLEVRDASNTSPWGEFRFNNAPSSGSFSLANYGAVPGVDRFTFSIDYFIPTSTVSQSNDTLGLLVRHSATANGTPYYSANGPSANTTTAERGVWKTLTFSQVISTDYDAATAGDQIPWFITPIVALSDAPNGSGSTGDNAQGVWIYYDNVRFSITPEPSKVLLITGSFAALWLRRRRF